MKDANGVYLIQTKENQPILSEQCSEWAKTLPCIAIVETNDKGHGRLTKRTGFFSIENEKVAPRWKQSAFATLCAVTRETVDLSTQKQLLIHHITLRIRQF